MNWVVVAAAIWSLVAFGGLVLTARGLLRKLGDQRAVPVAEVLGRRQAARNVRSAASRVACQACNLGVGLIALAGRAHVLPDWIPMLTAPVLLCLVVVLLTIDQADDEQNQVRLDRDANDLIALIAASAIPGGRRSYDPKPGPERRAR